MKKASFVIITLILAAVFCLSGCKLPENWDKPAATDESVATEAPVVTNAPVVTDGPVVTDAPVVTEAPVVTDVPVVTEAPVVTDAPQTDIYAVYLAAFEKTNTLNDAHYKNTTNMDMSIFVLGQTTKMTVVNTQETLVNNYLKPDMLVELHYLQSNVSDGETDVSSMDIFVNEENIYIREDEGDYMIVSRSDPSSQEFNEELNSAASYGGPAISEDMFKDAVITENADGSKTIKLSLTKEQFMAAFGDSISESLSTYGDIGAEDIQYDFEKINVSLLIDAAGYIPVINMTFEMNIAMKVYGIDATAVSEMTVTEEIIDAGAPVTITFPAM